MFCQSCGGELAVGQRFCGRCGRQVGIATVSGDGGRVARHVRMLAALWIAVSIFRVIGAFAVFFVGRFFLRGVQTGVPSGDFPIFLPGLMTVIAAFLGASALAGILLGAGLIQRDSWARTLGLVMGFLALLDPPFGTALGVYTLWVLMPARAEEEFRSLARAA